ncbi:MAG: DNA adenine methylase [Tannerella sp.]|jgi:DNA adenine methylase|nr:DNA adenine methylase [Tannerella sp.]
MQTPLTYYGGKQTMLKHIRPLVPPHTLYCEPFAGGAALFFDKEPAKVNVINDLNAELITFYRVLAVCPEDFKALVRQTLHSREQHVQAWHIYNHPSFFTDAQRAWAVWVLSKQGFGGQFSASFGFDKSGGKKHKKVQNAKSILENRDMQSLLEQATVECDDALAVIRRYDCPEAFHFIDPPYVGSNMAHYAGMFNERSLIELLDLCTALKGKFMLTMYPNETIREYAAKYGWHIHEVERQISACKAEHRRRQVEWMVINYAV